MNFDWKSFLQRLAADAPHLLMDGVNAYAAIAHGAGGPGKVVAAATDVVAVAEDVAAAAAPAQQQPPQ